MGEGEGGGEAGSRPYTLGHSFPPIPTFPHQGGRRGKPVQKFMSQYLGIVWLTFVAKCRHAFREVGTGAHAIAKGLV